MLNIVKASVKEALTIIFAELLMKKRGINIFLILIIVLQFLPMRQVISYFFDPNAATEEVVEMGVKEIKKSEDCKLHLTSFYVSLFDNDHSEVSFYHYNEQLPALYSKEVHTPPPNSLT